MQRRRTRFDDRPLLRSEAGESPVITCELCLELPGAWIVWPEPDRSEESSQTHRRNQESVLACGTCLELLEGSRDDALHDRYVVARTPTNLAEEVREAWVREELSVDFEHCLRPLDAPGSVMHVRRLQPLDASPEPNSDAHTVDRFVALDQLTGNVDELREVWPALHALVLCWPPSGELRVFVRSPWPGLPVARVVASAHRFQDATRSLDQRVRRDRLDDFFALSSAEAGTLVENARG